MEMIPFRRSNRLAGASGAQIPSRRAAAKPPPRTLGDSRRPCSSAQIQSRVAKRKYMKRCASWGAKRGRSALGGGVDKHVFGRSLPPPPHTNHRCVHLIHFRLPPSWGAKRSRSTLGCGGHPALPVRSIGCGGGKPALSVGCLPCPSNSTCTDWANLGDGPAGLIAEFALANDVADYIRFRSVCGPWRRCSPDPRACGLDGRFLPHRWIMLDKALGGPRLRRFLNTSTGECIRAELPELDEHTVLALTSEGLLLLFHEPTLVVRLLNPLTRQLTDLPPLTRLLSPEQLRSMSLGMQIGRGLRVQGAGLVADGSTVAVSFSIPSALAVAKPGDESWTRVDDTHMRSAVPFAGRLYCATCRGVMVLSFSSDRQPPRLLMVAERSTNSCRYSSMTDSLHLVDNGGELMLVHRMLRPGNDEDEVEHCENDEDEVDDGENDEDEEDDDGGKYTRKCVVYKVDLDVGVLIQVKDLNGRAVFLGKHYAISVSAETFPSIYLDTIYYGFDYCKDCGGYNISYRSMEPWDYSPLRPRSIVECLRSCVQTFPEIGRYNDYFFSGTRSVKGV